MFWIIVNFLPLPPSELENPNSEPICLNCSQVWELCCRSPHLQPAVCCMQLWEAQHHCTASGPRNNASCLFPLIPIHNSSYKYLYLCCKRREVSWFWNRKLNIIFISRPVQVHSKFHREEQEGSSCFKTSIRQNLHNFLAIH